MTPCKLVISGQLEPTRRYGPMPEDKLVVQTEDVLVDRRGFIYITDKNQGLWVLRYSGVR